MGYASSFWGPSAWTFLFTVAMNYDDHPSNRKAEEYTEFFTSVADILPCAHCRGFYKALIEHYPLEDFLSYTQARGVRDPCVRWLYRIRDEVNLKLRAREWERFSERREEIALMNVSPAKAIELIETARKEILLTGPSPPLEQVIEYYQQFRV